MPLIQNIELTGLYHTLMRLTRCLLVTVIGNDVARRVAKRHGSPARDQPRVSRTSEAECWRGHAPNLSYVVTNVNADTFNIVERQLTAVHDDVP